MGWKSGCFILGPSQGEANKTSEKEEGNDLSVAHQKTIKPPSCKSAEIQSNFMNLDLKGP